jgi:RNA polymerase sigma factor (sigma-70 family)
MSHDDPASSSLTFEQFMKEMGPKMKSLLASYRIPVEDAEDVLQQALLALIYQWAAVRDPESWLIGTLRRHCLMYWRTRRRRLYSAVDTTILEWLSQPLSPPQERNDLMCDLRQMIERLPPRCRSLLELRFQLGYEPGEVARRLGYRESSIAKVTNRCLAALARQLLVAGAPHAMAAAGELAPAGGTAASPETPETGEDPASTEVVAVASSRAERAAATTAAAQTALPGRHRLLRRR